MAVVSMEAAAVAIAALALVAAFAVPLVVRGREDVEEDRNWVRDTIHDVWTVKPNVELAAKFDIQSEDGLKEMLQRLETVANALGLAEGKYRAIASVLALRKQESAEHFRHRAQGIEHLYHDCRALADATRKRLSDLRSGGPLQAVPMGGSHVMRRRPGSSMWVGQDEDGRDFSMEGIKAGVFGAFHDRELSDDVARLASLV